MIYNSLYYCVFLLNTFDNIELLKELMLLKDKKYSYLFSYDGSLKNQIAMLLFFTISAKMYFEVFNMIMNITSTCGDSILIPFLSILKKFLNIIHIIVPLLLILSVTLTITKLFQDPDDKKAPKKIINSVIAIVIIFFLPVFLDVVVNLTGEDEKLTSCLNINQSQDSISSSYQEIDEGEKKKIVSSNYESGTHDDDTQTSDN